MSQKLAKRPWFETEGIRQRQSNRQIVENSCILVFGSCPGILESERLRLVTRRLFLSLPRATASLATIAQEGAGHAVPISKMEEIAFPPRPQKRLFKIVGMASCATKKLGSQLTKIALASQSFHCSSADQAGGPWRLKHAMPENGSQYGPMTDLPDWSFADGCPAPPMKGYLRRKEKNTEFVRRLAMISSEVDHRMEKWAAKVREQEQQAEEKRRNRLQPKGGILPPAPK
ncbi:PREDICTED: 39S ribosomal protein L52, mitochondrial [Gekko japonicus]|uniref:Large ribosomal subunit protein mL52 n=1 Tax=Gekko japonicus TaxID=146911 RepID=A0ABM1JUN6_GEKJA|nr:PREDICTED: 39S ribosomal protein L52, mitochondrial [Gekko japonicus]